MTSKIIHLIITTDDKNRYYCNRACKIVKEKSTWNKDSVTCKNCLRQLKRSSVYMQKRTFKIVDAEGFVK